MNDEATPVSVVITYAEWHAIPARSPHELGTIRAADLQNPFEVSAILLIDTNWHKGCGGALHPLSYGELVSNHRAGVAEIPVIDLAPSLAASPWALAATASELTGSPRPSPAFSVRNRGEPASPLEDIFAAAARASIHEKVKTRGTQVTRATN